MEGKAGEARPSAKKALGLSPGRVCAAAAGCAEKARRPSLRRSAFASRLEGGPALAGAIFAANAALCADFPKPSPS